MVSESFRKPVDTIHRLKSQKRLATIISRLLFAKVLAAFLGLVIIFNFGFWGAVGAFSVKEKADVLKMFESGKYLVLFQNNSEMRPTGGFIGSFAVITFSDYKIKSIDFNTNIFKLDNAFTSTKQVIPPAPLGEINNNHWALRDSNFDVSFSEASQDIQWFFNQETSLLGAAETGEKIDGVIGLNASLIQDLLKMTGGIYLEKYQTTITADNFFEELAEKIEKEYFYSSENQAENEPKTILKDMMPILIQKAFALPKTSLAKFLNKAMNEKMILLQSNNTAIQNAILASNWGGKVSETTSDYLYVNNANLTDTKKNKNFGAKTSLKIDESIDYAVRKENLGLVADLTLTRSHKGSYTWPDGVNINYTRILVPEGSTLVSAELNGRDVMPKIEIGREAGKTVFSIWINTAPQTSNVLNLKYDLPISANNYSLTLQKQPGNLGDNIQATFEDKVLYNGLLDTDKLVK